MSRRLDAWLRFAEPQARDLAVYLGADQRRVMVFAAATDGKNVVLTRAAAGETTTGDARAFIKILDAERARLAALVAQAETQ